MNYLEYYALFDDILTRRYIGHPYEKESYYNYTRLNLSRMRRWDKQLILAEPLVDSIKGITQKQQWIVITEPWCGDAAHIIPCIIKLIAYNPLISYDLQLRDTEPSLMQYYLTNGSRSIPKLVVRNEEGKDLFTWGPRPAGAQTLLNNLKVINADSETQKIQLQNWYNTDKGVSFCKELLGKMTSNR